MEKFARICTYTNQPINEGFYIGEEYVADTKEAKELFMAECEEYYFDENGNLIEQSN